ncbi:MAG: class I tRNA ligase family protein, partial [Planctomycetota bacterium]|nr:class I tRNA ligase family protein [Planctomycetota bacterium]
VSERVELGRNFSNKLWNASRFALMNLGDYQAGAVDDDQLQLEDRWILSRLSTVTAIVTDAFENYRYAEAARTLYDFAWDEFCSFYVEMVKSRFGDSQQGPVARRVLAHTLDSLLRLLHPMIPFLTEDVWQRLGEVAPQRGIPAPAPSAESIMIAPWPTADPARQDRQIEARFARFQAALGGIREIRSRQNVPPRQEVHFAVRCDTETADLLRPMEPYFQAMAAASATDWGPQTQAPELSSNASLAGLEIFVDLADLIDIDAEIARNEKELTRLQGMITGKEKKLTNKNFVDRAPADVVARERDSLAEQRQQLTSLEATLAKLRSRS